jgi:NAD(P)-dependent dehydrogenase (short-subunit alcohol dehydrogenase family)
VTGANTGLGKEVAQILYSKNAKVYMTARSERKTREAMESIQRASPTSSGELVFLHLDLTDLDSVKRSAKEFIQKENKLDILFNNAGVAYPGPLSHTKQGYELQLGTNCVGPFAFTKLLTPVLASTATDAPKGSVRVVWVSSSAIDAANPKDYVESLKRVDSMGGLELYGTSKLGNYLHAAEYARRYRSEGILSVSLNPGNLKTELLRAHEGKWIVSAINRILLYPSVYGAYTILFAGVSKQVNMGNTGSFGEHQHHICVYLNPHLC